MKKNYKKLFLALTYKRCLSIGILNLVNLSSSGSKIFLKGSPRFKRATNQYFANFPPKPHEIEKKLIRMGGTPLLRSATAFAIVISTSTSTVKVSGYFCTIFTIFSPNYILFHGKWTGVSVVKFKIHILLICGGIKELTQLTSSFWPCWSCNFSIWIIDSLRSIVACISLHFSSYFLVLASFLYFSRFICSAKSLYKRTKSKILLNSIIFLKF